MDLTVRRKLYPIKVLSILALFTLFFCVLLFLTSLQFNTVFDTYNKELPIQEDNLALLFTDSSTNNTDTSSIDLYFRNISDKTKIFIGSETNILNKNASSNKDKEDVYNETINLQIYRNSSRSSILEGIVTQKLDNLTAPGEQGSSFKLDPASLNLTEKEKYANGWKLHGFNQYVSDHISIQRSLNDERDPECLNITYHTSGYIDTSVIIIFFNEALSTLLRTAYSVLNRSPPHLIKEVILVDDCSDHDDLQAPLQKYVVQRMPKVKLIRSPKRLGLINARIYGINAASGMSYTFLDSHCECNEGWLEPLLERVSSNWTNVAMPIINPIDQNNFKFKGIKDGYSGKKSNVGGFRWTLDFDWIETPKSLLGKRKDLEPVRSPTMPGGVFTIHKDFFRLLGYYDPEFSLYGSENLELSFKIWMCGGVLEQIPCSHIGHIFRSHTPYFNEKANYLQRINKIRLAEVWMDDYKFYYYDVLSKSTNISAIPYGDVSPRRELRKQLHCKDFEWYLKNVYPQRYWPVNHLSCGMVRNLDNKCLTANFTGTHPAQGTISMNIFMSDCVVVNAHQMFGYMTEDKSIRCDLYCLVVYNDQIELQLCDLAKQEWTRLEDNLIHVESGLCLDMDDEEKLTLAKCQNKEQSQMWHWQSD